MPVRSRSFALLVAVFLVLLLYMSVQRPIPSAEEVPPTLTPIVGEAVGFAVSPPISDLPPEEELPPPDPDAPEEEMELRLEFRGPAADAGEGSLDPAIFPGNGESGLFSGLSIPARTMPGPLVSFAGLSTADNGSTVLPPDTVGDVGPNHYVQMTNIRFRIWDKAGNPLVPARSLASLFAPLGSSNRCSNVNDGDPIVLYDPLADRWLLSQFCSITVANPNNHQLIAISQTSDPTGAYYLYDFMMPNNKFNDYPHFGVWPDAYYMTDHQFNQAGTLWLGQGVFAFNRIKMLAGDPAAAYIYFDLFSMDPDVGGMLASDLDGLNPPPLGSPAYFMNWRADEYGDPADALQLFQFHADFAHPAASTFTQRPESRIPVPSFDPRAPGRNAIEQPAASSSQFLDAIQDRFMHRLAYRNFGSQESLVVTQTVNVGPDPNTPAGHQAAVRYYELRRNLPGGAFVLNNVATYAPDTQNRWMGSAAQDNQGNLAIGYSLSSSTVSPSIRYVGRLASDPPNGLFQGEATLITGSGRQDSTSGRWGDYSDLSVDPADDCTFWYTQEYYNSISTVNWLTRIGSFKFAECTAADKGTLQGTITNCANGAPISGAQVLATGGYVRSTEAVGRYAMATVPGTYGVTASRTGYLSANAAGFLVGNGGTTIADLCLVPIPVLGSAGAVTPTTEGCSPATGGLDPGETVSVALPLKNSGAADTLDLVATLLPGGGVKAPSGPQSYGALAAGGPSVSRTFSFTVDPNLICGGTMTVTLSLADGGTDLGTASFVLTLGEFFRENFDGQVVPALPAGWTDSSTGAAPPPAWATTNITGYFVSAPNGAFTGSSGSVSERRLDSPTLAVPPVSAQLTFKNNFSLQANADGGVLEISINGGAFTDILVAGGNFVSGGYNGTISFTSGSPIGGRAAWTGANIAGSNGFITTRVNLPGSALGHDIKLRWRAAFNNATSTTGGGWRIDDVSLVTSTCCGPIVVASPPAAVTQESCGPANGGVDPDETVRVSFPLQNTGTDPTVALVATLLPGGGVNAPTGAQTYGVISPGGPAVGRTFTFVPGGTCGGSITATLALQDGPTSLGNRTFTLSLGGSTTVFSQNFDGVVAPALPAGWVATRPLGTSPALWATSSAATNRVSPPNGAITAGSTSMADNRLDSPLFAVPSAASAQLTFNNNWSLEDGFDGGVLEISINGGPFTDIVGAGGSFVTGGYSGTISFEAGGSLAGRQAWTGSSIFGSNGFVSTKVNLPAAALGANIQLRWRAGFDASGNPSGSGWRIDDVVVSGLGCCTQECTLGCPSDVVTDNEPGECGKLVSFAAPTVTGSCGTVASSPPSGDFFGAGTTLVTSTATSTSGGGTAGLCTFHVTVNDVADPSILCPSDIVASTDPGQCSAVVFYPAPAATDNCAVLVGTDVPSGSTFPKGSTTVHATATDVAGRTASCSFRVTVNDIETPVITCPADVTVPSDPGACSAVVNYPAVTATDNCPEVAVDSLPPAGSTFPVGTTPVNGTATDTSGHLASCGFLVRVKDMEAPILTASLTPDLLWPPNHQLVPVTASLTVSDNCGATAILSGLTSSEPDNASGNGDGNTVDDIQNGLVGTLDLSFDLRGERAGTGQGRVYAATYTATDTSGNTASASAAALAPHDQDGVVDPVSLSVSLSSSAALWSWNSVPGTDYYSVVRGKLADLVEEQSFIDLGTVDCLEAATQQTSRSDSDTPEAGEVFFYLVAYHHGQSSTYGAPSATKPRVPAGGNCQ
ncbi:MAG: hypothetical protein DMH00_10660 [Acidobacteria bacterium]|nr:MAG: hypothetical protein DMH00_10660 [Acidobacteriota bacterium]